MIFFIFYGVEYSCFLYCFGVYELVCKVIEIFDEYYFDFWNKNEFLLMMVVVLLYDIGYGVYFYIFECFFNIDYEVYIQEIIINFIIEINVIL